MDSVLNALNEFAKWVSTIPDAVWITLLGGFLVAPIGGLVKLVRKYKNGKMVLAANILAAIYSGIVFWIDSNPHSPLSIAAQSATVYVAAQPFYYLFVKKIVFYVTDKFEKASILEAQARTAVEPPTGVVPVTPAEAFDN